MRQQKQNGNWQHTETPQGLTRCWEQRSMQVWYDTEHCYLLYCWEFIYLHRDIYEAR